MNNIPEAPLPQPTAQPTAAPVAARAPHSPVALVALLVASLGIAATAWSWFDSHERIRDLKTVEGWLRTNLSMLSMTIQNLEMQRTTLSAVRTMSQMYSDAQQGGGAPAGDEGSAFAQAAMWPWQMMQQMQESMQQATQVQPKPAAEATPAAAAAAGSAASNGGRRKKSG